MFLFLKDFKSGPENGIPDLFSFKSYNGAIPLPDLLRHTPFHIWPLLGFVVVCRHPYWKNSARGVIARSPAEADDEAISYFIDFIKAGFLSASGGPAMTS